MALSKLKEEYLKAFVAFGGKGHILLGDRDDIDELALMARRSRDKQLMAMFESLPSEAELQKHITDLKLSAIPAQKVMAEEKPNPGSTTNEKPKTRTRSRGKH